MKPAKPKKPTRKDLERLIHDSKGIRPKPQVSLFKI